ncbi:MAG: chemotaxis protein CheW [Sporolactobacillus sp.]
MENTMKVILFNLDSEAYGVSINQVLSIEKVESVSRVPGAPDFVEGVMNLRGSIIPVISMRRKFRMKDEAQTKETRIVIVQVDEIQVGLLVDAAKEVIDIDADKIEAAPEIVGGLKAEYIRGVYELDESHLLVLLDLHHVLNDQDVDQVKKIEVSADAQVK